ncbi:hypothetical protein [Desulfovibrio sp. TomC]|uniref:hypothetical protein n=1 Tax=Desulfovibrio sp. TomC TaxID=1562888 RepID=UPI0005749428|nr:hypothetical protein [Desulfovibrio sp. TomC]KHK03617.1 hypothetical protein NY78_0673 [Desulfovibrio sp. TomC]
MSETTRETCLESLKTAFDVADEAYVYAVSSEAPQEQQDTLYTAKLKAEKLYLKAVESSLFEDKPEVDALTQHLDAAIKKAKDSLNHLESIAKIIEAIAKILEWAGKLVPYFL